MSSRARPPHQDPGHAPAVEAGERGELIRHAHECQPGTSLVIGRSPDRDVGLCLVALRRASTEQWQIVEISPDAPTRVLHTVFGGDQAAPASVTFALEQLAPERPAVRSARQAARPA